PSVGEREIRCHEVVIIQEALIEITHSAPPCQVGEAGSRFRVSLGSVYEAEGYAKSGTGFSDLTGRRAMGYFDQGFLNYYYFMASNFALSDRWFSPVASKTIP